MPFKFTAAILTIAALSFFPQTPATIPNLPSPITWHNAPTTWNYDKPTNTLTISAAPKTDTFVESASNTVANSAPVLLFTPTTDFILTTQVTVNFAAKYDSGALILWADAHHWAKLSYEQSPNGTPAVSTVVTKGTSDTWNSKEFQSTSIYLRVAKSGNVYIFFSSPDATTWQKLRTFNLDTDAPVQAGFQVQSPAGAGTTAKFSNITYDPHRIATY
jgi:uncharacterized protein